MTTVLERRRTGWDVVLGILLVLGGLFVLGNAALATALSVLILGWVAVGAGVVVLVGAFVRRGGGFSWSAALGGAVLVVLGVFILRNPLAGAVSFTLLMGALFLAVGLARIVGASQAPELRGLLIVSGIFSIILGLVVLLNLVGAATVLLGILLGIQIVIEGVTLLVGGRARPARPVER